MLFIQIQNADLLSDGNISYPKPQ